MPEPTPSRGGPRRRPYGPLSHDDAGAGPALVLVHGFPHTRALWRAQVAPLAAQHRVIVPDLRGFGASGGDIDDDDAEASIATYADDVMRLLDHLGIGRAVIGGLSMGGYVALQCWGRHRERVAGLALCDTRAAADDAGARSRRDALRANIAVDGPAPLLAAMLPGMLGKSTRRDRPALVDEVSRMMQTAAPVHALDRALRAMRDRPDATPLLATIDVPVLVLVGEEDVLTPPADADAILAALPADTPRLGTVVPQAGHVSCLERPAAVTHALQELLTLVGPF